MTALHWAARRGETEMVRMLVAAGANVRAITRLGNYTPLILASQGGHAAIIDTLAAAGADVKATTAAGVTPLMLASASGQVDAVKTLIARGADVNAAEPTRGETALMFAAANRRSRCGPRAARREGERQRRDEGGQPEGRAAESRGRGVSGRSRRRACRRRAREAQAPAGAAGSGPAGGGRAGRQNATPATPAAQPPAPSAAQAPTAPATQAPAATRCARSTGRGRSRGRWWRGGGGGGGGRGGAAGVAGVSRPYTYAELINGQGGLTPLLFSTRQGDLESVKAILDAGAPIDAVSGGDGTSPMLMATINGHFDLAAYLLDRGANPKLASDNGVTPLYAALNVQWAPRALYPQPRTHLQQKLTYLDFMKQLLDKGVDPNVRLLKKVWYQEYNFPLLGVDEIGATPFWRAAYAADVDAMKLLVAHGADPNIPTIKPAGRPRTGDAAGRETIDDVSGLPPVPIAGPGIPALLAAAGAGYGEGFAGNSHRTAPGGFLPAVQYLVDVLHVDVNSRDHEGNTALHDAAARGDVPMIEYLVSKGADVKALNRAGETTADMANSPVSRIEPYPEALALLVKLGAKNNGKCKACS